MKAIKDYIQESKHSFKIKSHLKKQNDYVDLGLPSGNKWATCNIGANKPEEYGDLFAWGEVKPQAKNNNSFCVETYKWFDEKAFRSISKNIPETLESHDDTAYVITKGEFRMPSVKDFKELMKYTEYKQEVVNGVNGLMFTSIENGKTMFVPFTGYYANGSYEQENETFSLWANEFSADKGGSFNLFFEGELLLEPSKPYFGFNVRGILN